jgi:hypothetical protein
MDSHPIFKGSKTRKKSLVQYGTQLFNFGGGSSSQSQRPEKEEDPDLKKMEGMTEVERRVFVVKRSQEARYERHRRLKQQYDARGYEEHWVNV